MKIAILLPFKDTYTKNKAGSASIWVKDFIKNSKFKKNITVYGYIKNLVKEDLINKIENIQKSKSYIALIAFRYNYIYICFIILLLSIEWFYRKKIGFN